MAAKQQQQQQQQFSGDGFTSHIAGMSKSQLYEIMSQLKVLIDQNQKQARQILIENPLLTRALFQAQIMLGMVQPPQVMPTIPQQSLLQSAPSGHKPIIHTNQPLPAQAGLQGQKTTPQPSVPARPQQHQYPPISIATASVPMLASYPSQQVVSTPAPPQQAKPFFSGPPGLPPHSSQIRNIPQPPHPHSHFSMLQSHLPMVSSQPQPQPQPQPSLQTPGMFPQPLQPPLPQQPRPPMQHFPHQLPSQMPHSLGFPPSSAPQHLLSPPLFHSGGLPPSSFPQGQPPLPNLPPPQQFYQVTSKNDQKQYWAQHDKPYQYVPVKEFSKKFHTFHVGKNLRKELSVPFDRNKSHSAALTTSKFGISGTEILKACAARELLLMKRNSFVYAFRACQIMVMALVTMSLLWKTEMPHRSINDGQIYIGALFFSIVALLFNGFSELALTIIKLPVYFKQRDAHFYPSWAFALPNWILNMPFSCIEVAIWVLLTYFTIGFDSSAERFFKHYLLLLLLNQMSSGVFRFIAVLGRILVVANVLAAYMTLMILVLGGFLISYGKVKKWWLWGFWASPIMYSQNAISVNEFLGKSWSHILPGTNETLGIVILKSRGIFPEANWYWIGAGALLGHGLIFNFLFIVALSYLKSLGKGQSFVTEEVLREQQNSIFTTSTVQSREKEATSLTEGGVEVSESMLKKGMVLPFVPHCVTFDNISYSVDIPKEMRAQKIEDKLMLLNGVSGCFRPGVLTALMGVSGAGKTTLMDVLAGRKTKGYITGSITISGFPKRQETFARVSGYCEQNDIHSPNVTVYESLIYSAWLRLPPEIDASTRKMFVYEVMELVEMRALQDALVGLPGISGLSTEQRKRLTIAVELVANPSIIFMDEPTSGLDARSAAIVMRTVRNTVDTGRTVVCTIHQPSIEIFESFDELFLMKLGGEEIYFGPLGHKSHQLVNYFESIQGITKITDNYNPATWMLEVVTSSQEDVLGVNFNEIYKNSELYKRNKALIMELSQPSFGSNDLYFPTQYSQPFLTQCGACLWKQNLSYWRNPIYSALRFFFTVMIALMLGSMFWNLGSKKDTQQDLFNAMGSMFGSVFFMGASYSIAVQPIVAIERTVFYRERAAGMYSAFPYAFGQIAVELPYIFVQSLTYCIIVYSMIGFEWTTMKFLWYLYFSFFTLLYYTYYGMLAVGLTSTQTVASIVSTFFFGMWNLFSGFIVPKMAMPIWWSWFYWVCPFSWTLYGLFASQYGNDHNFLDTKQTVAEFLSDYFGFKHNFLLVVAVMIVFFAMLFAFLFGFAIKVLNFQNR